MHVHGHGQCTQCGANVEPCCGGAGNSDVAAGLPASHIDVEPGLFARLFLQLGGERKTVTRAALEGAYVARQGGDLAEAREVIDAAVRLGMLLEGGPGWLRLA